MKQLIYILSPIFFLSLVSSAAEVDYYTDIAPIFRDYCAGCHNESDYEGEFSVETFTALKKGGESEEVILTPGSVEKSFLATTILKKSMPAMPPKKEPQLSEVQINLIARWIREGAKGPAGDEDQSIIATLNVTHIEPARNVVKAITAAASSPDGKQLAIARYGTVEVGERKFELGGKVNAVHFSPDGTQIITASGVSGLKGIASVWDIKTGEEVLAVGEDAHRDILYDAEFSPDGRLIATAGYDRTIRIWEADTGKYLRKIEGHNGAIFDIAFSPDSSLLASASADETGKIWKVANGQRLDTLNQPQAEQFRISFTPDGRFIVAAGGDKKIRLWRLLSKTKPSINPVLRSRFAHEEAISGMAMSRDGKWLATASADRSVKVWSLPGLAQVNSFSDQADYVSVLTFLPDGSLFAGRMNGQRQVYSIGGAASSTPTSKGYYSQPKIVPTNQGEVKIQEYSEGKGDVLTLALPARVRGVIGEEGDTDDYRFAVKKDQAWVIEVDAARSKSLLDSKIEVLTAAGQKIEKVVLQAVRDSWFTFRGKDSNTSDDFRVHNWREMELNEYLYADGEVVKLWHYPRGPDSGFKVYPGFGNRRTYFDTTALSHPLGGPCHIVEPLAPGTKPSPNGLPVYHLYWENDDDSERLLGKDSKLIFRAPRDGDYMVRISDVRNFGGEKFTYALTVRPPRPDFSVSHNGANLKISPGSGDEVEFVAKHIDGFEGEIDIAIENLPSGYTAHPITIEKEQKRAYLAIQVRDDARNPSAEQLAKIKVMARARGTKIVKTLPALGMIGLGNPSKLKVDVFPDGKEGRYGSDGILEIDIEPGETVSALVKADRIEFKGQINFGKDDSGRNLPHGVFVDNIGLNGLMIPVGKSEQRFWITAAKWVPDTERIFHLRASEDGKQTTKPVRIRVRKAK